MNKILILFSRYIHRFTGIIFCKETDLAEACKNMLNTHDVSAPRPADCFNPDYYQELHDNNKHYQQNNWLVEDRQTLSNLAIGVKTVVELACGNGRFCRSIAKSYDRVIGIDWAKSPELDNLPKNVFFLQKNILRDELPSADLVCSADFLEHLPPSEVGECVARIISIGSYGYHRIACYDDGHSHLSILSPSKWLSVFRVHDETYRVSKVSFRGGNINCQVVTLTNLPTK